MAYVAGPYDDTHLYVQWGGKLPGNEEWSCGVRMANTTGTGITYSSTMHDGVTAAVQAYHTAVNTNISSRAKLSFVKMNLIAPDGTYADETTNEDVLADIAGAGSTAYTPPNQVALAVSLTTGFSRGPAHRGRFYLPLPCFTVGAEGLIAPSEAAGLGTVTDTFLAALNAANAAWKVAVFSRKSGAAAHRLVTGNEVGVVLDTQRRRRRSLIENYQ